MSEFAAVKTQLQTQMVQAMKAGDKLRTQTVRMVLSEVKALESDHPEGDPQTAITGYAKKLRKAMQDFEKLNAGDRVEAIKAELKIVEEFLPKPMDDAALEALVSKVISDLAAGPKDAGKVMGAVLKQAAGAADAVKVRAMVAAKLPHQA